LNEARFAFQGGKVVYGQAVNDGSQQPVLNGFAQLGIGFPGRIETGGDQFIEGLDSDPNRAPGPRQPLPKGVSLQAGGDTDPNIGRQGCGPLPGQLNSVGSFPFGRRREVEAGWHSAILPSNFERW